MYSLCENTMVFENKIYTVISMKFVFVLGIRNKISPFPEHFESKFYFILTQQKTFKPGEYHDKTVAWFYGKSHESSWHSG